MRILMITDVYFPRINGVSTSIQIFMRELERLGHQVTLIAPDYGQTATQENIIRIPSGGILFDPEDRLLKRRKVLALRQQLKQQNFDVIHIQTPFVAHYLGVALAREFGIPCIESYHTYFEEYLFHYVPFVPKPWMRALARYFTRKQCNAVNAVVVPSTAMQDVLISYGVNALINIIPTGMELDRFKGGDGAHFRTTHHIEPDRPVMTFIGRVAFEKNIEFLLDVTVNLRIRIPNVLLVIAGEGPALHSLQRRAHQLKLDNNVLFVGYLNREKELLDCYRAGDIFVFASRTETQGLVLLEAMALGVPVVSTAMMGTCDILRANRGALVAKENVEQFADAAARILTNPLLHERLHREALNYVQEWSAPIMAAQLVGFYQTLTESAPASAPVTKSVTA